MRLLLMLQQGGAGGGEMMRFPSDGSAADVLSWVKRFKGGKYLGIWKERTAVPVDGDEVANMSEQSLITWLGTPTGSIIHNAIHKHDRPAATTSATAATGRLPCFVSFVLILWASWWRLGCGVVGLWWLLRSSCIAPLLTIRLHALTWLLHSRARRAFPCHSFCQIAVREQAGASTRC